MSNDVLVCLPAGSPSPWSDNETGPCTDCGRLLMFRPHVAWVPRKCCYDCAIEAIEAETEPVVIHLTKRTKAELREYRLQQQRKRQD